MMRVQLTAGSSRFSFHHSPIPLRDMAALENLAWFGAAKENMQIVCLQDSTETCLNWSEHFSILMNRSERNYAHICKDACKLRFHLRFCRFKTVWTSRSS